MADIRHISTRLEEVRKDPSIMQSFILGLLEEVSDGGIVVVDPNNPFALGIEMATALAVNNIEEMKQLTRQTYPSLADSLQDIYPHMSDYDYRDAFAVPGSAMFTILIDREEAMSKAVIDHTLLGTRKLTIPRYTCINVSDTTFTILYPIDIKFIKHGGILVTYDNDSPTGLQPLTTNMLQWDIIKLENREFIRINVEVQQLKIERYIPQISASSGFSRVYSFSGYFHFCRAFVKGRDSSWVEIRTTHSDKVYDPHIQTVVLQVTPGGLKVTIPQVYTNNGLITDAVRLDIYTTKGPLNLTLNMLEPSEFSMVTDYLSTETLSEYSAPLLSFNRISVYSTDIVRGGTAGMDYAELRQRVIGRSLNTEGLPITNRQLYNRVSDMGYTLVTNIDNITERQFLATKRLPVPSDLRTITGITASVETLQKTMDELGVSKHVTKNSIRDTIKPTMLYEMIDGVLQIVEDYRRDNLFALKEDSPEMLTRLLNRHQFLYSPFYYILDSTVDDFGCRVYDLDSPAFIRRFFSDMNDVGTNFSIINYEIINSANNDGYHLLVEMDVGQVGTELGPDFLYVQLSYLGKNGRSRYWINGEMITPLDDTTGKPMGGRYIYRFHIETRYDVDPDDGLILIPYKDTVGLKHDFDIVTIIRNYLPHGQGNHAIDSLVDKPSLRNYDVTQNYTSISHERITLEFGHRLKHLWHRTRTIPNYNAFETWDKDEIDYYKEDVYLMNNNGTPKVKISPDGKVLLTKLHSKGDRRIDSKGDTIYKHRAGDIKLDDDGKPIIKGGTRGLLRHIDLFLLDARYLFVDNPKDVNYRNAVVEEVVDWCTTDMVSIHNQLLERSEIFFYPVRTTGRVNVLADNNLHVSVNAEQFLEVTYWVTEENYKNTTLREAIDKRTVQTIQFALSRNNISLDGILDDLRLELSTEIVAVRVDGFTGGLYSTITIKDGSMGLSVGKSIITSSNNQLEIKDAITVKFLIHGI